MFSFFKTSAKKASAPLLTDIHSHLLPGLDDGVKSLDEALGVIRQFSTLGYQSLVTTPHIMSDHYRNTPQGIQAGLEELRNFLRQQNVSMRIEAAAEYYLDEVFIQSLQQDHLPLTIGPERYLLFETNYLNEPYQLKDFIFKLITRGYKPILAHPERYEYLLQNFEKVEDLRNRGVLFQLNMLSLINYYSKPVRKMAEQLVEKGWVELLGSDCHNLHHVRLLTDVRKNRYYRKALELPLLNNTLL